MSTNILDIFTHPLVTDPLEAKEVSNIHHLLMDAYRNFEPAPVPIPVIETLHFRIEEEGLTVYNPVPVMIGGRLHLWGRVERVETQVGSVRLFHQAEDGQWEVVPGAPAFDRMQDPFYCGVVEGWHVMGGVQITSPHDSPRHDYHTAFWRYRDNPAEIMTSDGVVSSPFTRGPQQMKGIRLVEIAPGRIGVFTRPQGADFGGAGRIGYFEISRLDDLQPAIDTYYETQDLRTLVGGLFGDSDWGGVNQALMQPDGSVFVLGHIAGFFGPQRLKYYYPMCFSFDPDTRSVYAVKLLATDKTYPRIPPKKADLAVVYYPGGIVEVGGERHIFYGLGDRVCARQILV